MFSLQGSGCYFTGEPAREGVGRAAARFRESVRCKSTSLRGSAGTSLLESDELLRGSEDSVTRYRGGK